MSDEPYCVGKSEAKRKGWAKLKADSKALEETILLCGKCQEERKARDAQLREKLKKIKTWLLPDRNYPDTRINELVDEALLLVEEAKTR